MRTKKSLGQHFLKSEKALNSIIRVGELSTEDIVVEIGPGTGLLTNKLLETGAKVVAIEKDDKLFETLQRKYEKEISSKQLVLVHDDILNFDPLVYKLASHHYKLIANIPYNLTGVIIRKFLEAETQPERMVLLVQKEVAERIVARGKPFDSAQGKESVLSISVKVYGIPKYVETVKAGSFVPRPKVDSAIIAIENVSKSFFPEMKSRVDTECQQVEKRFFGMVRAGFKSKRKKLSSNLSTLYGKGEIQKTFRELDLGENLRAEDVDVETWGKLAKHLLEW